MNFLVPPHKISQFAQPRRGTGRRLRVFVYSVAFLVGALPAFTAAIAQDAQPAPTPAPAAQEAQPATNQAAPPQATPQPEPSQPPQAVSAIGEGWTFGVTEEGLQRQLVGKQLLLRGGYLGDSLAFDENGNPTGHPLSGSYTLSAIEIQKVKLTKHKVELTGIRYGLHFLGALPYEDPNTGVDRVRITPKKKTLKITIDRELVIKPKKAKEEKSKSSQPPKSGPASSSETGTPSPAQTAPAQPTAPPTSQSAETASTAPANNDADDKDDDAKDSKDDQAAAPSVQTRTISPAHSAKVLHDALDRVFAVGADAKFRAQMPEFWQLYYQAQDARRDYRTKDPSVLRSNAVDQQAKLVTSINPESNEYAQANGVAGRALYRVVITADGKPGEIAVIRPIGFGLDENAVAAIGKATFQPALKDGKPVAESLDLAVLFRIYSKRTSETATKDDSKPATTQEPIKPGPYSVQAPPQQQPQQ